VKVFKVEVSSEDSIVLYRHDQDTVAIPIEDQLVTVGIPGASRWKRVPVGRPSRVALIWEHTKANGEPLTASTQIRNPATWPLHPIRYNPEVRGKMRFAKAVFLVAGIYGLLILTPIYFMENAIGQRTPPAITHPEYFYGFLGAGLACQALFLVLSSDPVRYRAMILPSVLEKVSYGIALIVLYAQGRLPLSVLSIGSVDRIFAFLFLAAYFTTKSNRADV